MPQKESSNTSVQSIHNSGLSQVTPSLDASLPGSPRQRVSLVNLAANPERSLAANSWSPAGARTSKRSKPATL